MIFTIMQIVIVNLVLAHTNLVNGWPLPPTVNLTPPELPYNFPPIGPVTITTQTEERSTEISTTDESSYEITESTIEPLQIVTENQPRIIAPIGFPFSFPFSLSTIKAKVLQSLGFPFIPQFFKNWLLPLPLPVPLPLQLPLPVPLPKPLPTPTLQPITMPTPQIPTIQPLLELPGTPVNVSAPPGLPVPIPIL